MKKGSEDIRSLAVRNVLAGKYSVAQVAEMTGYSIATIYNWISIYKKERRLTAKPAGHRQPVFSQSEHEQVKTMIQEKPDITLVEIRERLNKKCCLDPVHNMVKRLGLTLKTLESSEQDRSDVVQKRGEWREFQKILRVNALYSLMNLLRKPI